MRKALLLFFVASVFVGLNTMQQVPRLSLEMLYPPLSGARPPAVYGWPFAFYPKYAIDFPANAVQKGYRTFGEVDYMLLLSNVLTLLVVLWIVSKVLRTHIQK